MPLGLKRYQQEGDDHFITFSCHGRQPYLSTPLQKTSSSTRSNSLATATSFGVIGYVVMPEHVHILLSEPPEDLLSKAL